MSWRAPGAPRRRCRRITTAAAVDVSSVGISLVAETAEQFAPGVDVVLWCGVHEMTGVVRRCEPVGDHAMRYGIEFVAVADATVDKLMFYARSSPVATALAPSFQETPEVP